MREADDHGVFVCTRAWQVEASDRFVEECEMGLPEMTRFLTSAYKCVFAFGSAQSATVPKAAADAQATGESALRTESPQRSAFLRSVEALESYRCAVW